MFREDSDKSEELLAALESSKDIYALRSMCGQGLEEYALFCKKSIVPVELGINP